MSNINHEDVYLKNLKQRLETAQRMCDEATSKRNRVALRGWAKLRGDLQMELDELEHA